MDKQKAEKWTDLFAEFKNTKLGAKAFCQDKQLSFHQFQYWKKRLNAAGTKKNTSFIPLKVRSAEPNAITICHGNFRIELPDAFDPDTVKRLIRCFQ